MKKVPIVPPVASGDGPASAINTVGWFVWLVGAHKSALFHFYWRFGLCRLQVDSCIHRHIHNDNAKHKHNDRYR